MAAILALTLAPAAGSAKTDLYVYGKIEGCPHCVEVIKSLLKAGAELNAVFADIDHSIAAGDAFATAYERLFPDLQKYHIPLTVVARDGEAVAAIFGVFSPKDAIYLADKATETGKLVVVYPDRRIYYWDRGEKSTWLKLLADTAAKYGEPIEELRGEVERAEAGGSGTMIFAVEMIVAAALLAAFAAYLRRRRAGRKRK